jgi:mannose/cellobiose epimerase-like protein (N-acyl-D-glucosamine 2-epimerase family)/anti-anti-sigma regulatory factor
MGHLTFTFSDLVAGYVTAYDPTTDTFGVKTSDGREFKVGFTPTTYAELVRNLGEAYHDATGQMRDMLDPGRFLYAYGIVYPQAGAYAFEAKHLVFLGRTEADFRFEAQDWWINQIRQLADFYLKAQFGDGEIDFSKYRTNLLLTGEKAGSGRQECDTISRHVYGFASAFLMTGDDRYLEAAAKGTEYLRKHHRFEDKSAGICYWYHAVDIRPDGSEQKIFASEFGDDYDAIPCYEQIYALAGPTQTYRITGDPLILSDIKATINLFNRYFKDPSERGGYYSHIDPIMLSPLTPSLGENRAKKNWNSVGDHAPAYLINLYLATGAREYADFLEYTFDTIARYFPDYDHSPFVNEKFNTDWSPDYTTVQKNRAIVGHNLKIAWNLMRMQNLKPKDEYLAFAKRIAAEMPKVGMDKQRGGWFDMVERALQPGQEVHRFVWHDRKAWWQQEQGILAYLILAGTQPDPEYRRLARESCSFYNAWLLDTESGGVYFAVLAEGIPYLLGTERHKGSHSEGGYHAFELAYLASVYTNLLFTKEPMDFYFKPVPGGFPDGILRVAPDLLPPGSVRIDAVWVNGAPFDDFDAKALTVRLPPHQGELKVRVRLVPAEVRFSADLLDVVNGSARIALSGELDRAGLKYLEERIADVEERQVQEIVFVADQLQSLDSEALRYLVFTKQKLGGRFRMTVTGATGQVKEAIDQSEFNEELAMQT